MTRDNRSVLQVSSCQLGDEELSQLAECIRENWITMGAKVRRFEELFARYCGVRHAMAACNGTASLHLALIAVRVGPGDEVILPDLTYVASANAVVYCGAKPALCDVTPDTGCLDPEKVERRITRRTKAIMAVHLYGHPCDMDALREIGRKHGIAVVEDAAEAHGAEVNGKRAGSLGDVGSFSFYGNKMITTGEGGMCTTDCDEIAQRVRLYRGQGVDPGKRYWHPVVGYNYRMTDLQGAVGCAQMQRIAGVLSQRRRLAAAYEERLKDSGLLLPVEKPWARNAYWMYSIAVPGIFSDERDRIIRALSERGVEARPVFYPLHQLPPYASLGDDSEFPVATRLGRSGISLPTHGAMTDADVERVVESLQAVVCLRRSPESRTKAEEGPDR